MTTHTQDGHRHRGSVEQVLLGIGAFAVIVIVVILAATQTPILAEKIASSIAGSLPAAASIR